MCPHARCLHGACSLGQTTSQVRKSCLDTVAGMHQSLDVCRFATRQPVHTAARCQDGETSAHASSPAGGFKSVCRPITSAAAYGGGRNLAPGEPLETEEQAKERAAATAAALKEYRRSVGLLIEPEVGRLCAACALAEFLSLPSTACPGLLSGCVQEPAGWAAVCTGAHLSTLGQRPMPGT